ncbi:MAG: putative lipoprotein [Ilumatobacteraceae bacterium]|nr:putative lipoprotein [Ilumatobacteraceae bacterium]
MTLVLLAAASCSSDSKSASTIPVQAATAATSAATTATTQPSLLNETAATTASAAGETADTTAGTTAESVAPVADGSTATTAPGGADAVTDVALDTTNPFGTALAITASVTVQVADVRTAVNDLSDLVTNKGGAIFDSQVEVGDPDHATATITVKIPPTSLEGLISGLGGLGELTGRTQQTEDVAGQLADTNNRIAAAQASVDRVRFLLADAKSLDDVIRIEGELTIRETNLEQLLASQRNVQDTVQLATLTVVFTPKPKPAPVVVVPPKKLHVDSDVHPPKSVGNSLRAGWHGFVTVVHAIVVGVAFALPLLVLLLVAGLIWLPIRRVRRRPKRTALAADSAGD